jgi:hypothetical protein
MTENYETALAAASLAMGAAVAELALEFAPGQPFKPNPALVESFMTTLPELDKAWRDYVRRVNKPAGPIVTGVIQEHLGSAVASVVETALEAYRQV